MENPVSVTYIYLLDVSIGSKQQAPSICSSRKQSKKRKKISVDEINTLYDELARQWDEYEIAHHHRYYIYIYIYIYV